VLHHNGAFRQRSKDAENVLKPGQHFILVNEPGSGIAPYVARVLNMQIQHQSHQRLRCETSFKMQDGPV